MGSKLLYGLSFCIILWWLLRYYLIPWRRQSHQRNTRTSDQDHSTELSSNQGTQLLEKGIAKKEIANDPSNFGRQSPPPQSAETSNLSSDTSINVNTSTSAVTVENDEFTTDVADEPEEEEVDLNATTDLQGQLEVLHLEKERIRSTPNKKSVSDYGSSTRAEPLQTSYSLDLQDQDEDQLREHAFTLEKQIDENNRDITMLCTELREARQYESKYHENDKRIAEYLTLLAEKDEELDEAQQRLNQLSNGGNQNNGEAGKPTAADKHTEELQSAADRIATLEASIGEKENSINQFRAQQKITANLQISLATKDNEIKQLRSDLKQVEDLKTSLLHAEKAAANQTIELQEKQKENHRLLNTINQLNSQNAGSQSEGLEQKLKMAVGELTERNSALRRLESAFAEKNNENARLKADNAENSRNATSKAELATRLESALQSKEQEIVQLKQEFTRSSMLESSLQEKEQELARLAKVTAELQENQLRLRELNVSLSKAEQETTENKQNDLELRRLRSELQGMAQERDKSAQQIVSLQDRLSQQQQQIDASASLRQRIQELENLETTMQSRDRQISDLTRRLEQFSSSKKPEAAPLQPLFTAPKEKDNLKLIKGIGPVMEKTLNSLGVTSFKQLSEFNQQDIDKVSNALATFSGRIERDDWVGGAKVQYQKKYTPEIET